MGRNATNDACDTWADFVVLAMGLNEKVVKPIAHVLGIEQEEDTTKRCTKTSV